MSRLAVAASNELVTKLLQRDHGAEQFLEVHIGVCSRSWSADLKPTAWHCLIGRTTLCPHCEAQTSKASHTRAWARRSHHQFAGLRAAISKEKKLQIHMLYARCRLMFLTPYRWHFWSVLMSLMLSFYLAFFKASSWASLAGSFCPSRSSHFWFLNVVIDAVAMESI